MNTNVQAWVAGYRLGRDGKPPAVSPDAAERELKAIEETDGEVLDTMLDWMFHMQGWNVGQGIAQFEIGKL